MLVQFAVPEENDFSWLDTVSFGNGDFEPVFQRGTQGKATCDAAGATCSSGAAATRDDEDEGASNQKSCDSSPSEGPDISSQKLFTCPEEGCTKYFVRYSSLEKHCEYGAHVRALEKVTLQDKAKLSYAQRLEEGQTKPLCSVTVVGSPYLSFLDMGWALKSKPKATRFSEKQKSFLERKFLQGEKSGKKETGETVAKEMRKAKDPNNRRLFKLEEFLTPQQISSYFSRFAARRKQLSESDYDAAENDHVLREVREDIMLSLEQDLNRCKHPIMHGELQLCNMPEDELSLLRMATLKAICKKYGIDVSGRRKEPYVKGIVSFLASCTCKSQS